MNTSTAAQIEAYLAWADTVRGKSKATLLAEHSDLMQLELWMNHENLSLWDIRTKDLESFLASISQSKASSTIDRMVSSLHSFFDYLSIRYEISDEAALIQGPSRKQKLPVWCSKEQMGKLLDGFEDDDRGILNRTILMTLYCTGLRVSELCSLGRRDVRLDQKQIRVLGKGGRERIVPLPDACIDQLRIYSKLVRPNAKHAGNYYFASVKGGVLNRQYVYRLVKKAAADHELSASLSPHSLRHSYATRLMEEHTDLRLVQELLGHADISTTQIYTHVDGSRLRSGYDAAMPEISLDESGWTKDNKQKT